jgi:hypothetical protein
LLPDLVLYPTTPPTDGRYEALLASLSALVEREQGK